MSDFPEKAPDRTNALAVLVIGLATTAILWASVIALQAYFENTQGEISAARKARGLSAEVRDLNAEQRADLSKTAYADATKGTLKRLNVETAKSLVVRDAKGGGSLIPTLGELNVPTIPAAAGRPVDGASSEPAAPVDGAAPAAPVDGAAPAAPVDGAAPAAPAAAPAAEPTP